MEMDGNQIFGIEHTIVSTQVEIQSCTHERYNVINQRYLNEKMNLKWNCSSIQADSKTKFRTLGEGKNQKFSQEESYSVNH